MTLCPKGNMTVHGFQLMRWLDRVTTHISTTPIETDTDREDTMDTETLVPTLLEERRSLLVMKEHRKLYTARVGNKQASQAEQGQLAGL